MNSSNNKEVKMSDKDRIELLAKTVRFAIAHLDGTGEMIDTETGKSAGHWPYVFAERLRKCGFEIDDEAIDYARTPPYRRRGKEWEALKEKLVKKGYSV